ncbi:Protein diaphanous [Schistosoma japonicum]|nr:Protein diaphanous [Schistosoma japonicum]
MMDKNDLGDITSESHKTWKYMLGKFNLSYRKSKTRINAYNGCDDKLNEPNKFAKQFNKSLRESKRKTNEYINLLKGSKENEEMKKQSSFKEFGSNKEISPEKFNSWSRRTFHNRLYSSMIHHKRTTELVRNSKYLFGSQEISPNTKLAQYDVNIELMNKFRTFHIRELEEEPVKRIKTFRGTSEKCIQTSLIAEEISSTEEAKNDSSKPSPDSQCSSSGYGSDVTIPMDSPNNCGDPEILERIDERFISVPNKQQHAEQPETPVMKSNKSIDEGCFKVPPPPLPPISLPLPPPPPPPLFSMTSSSSRSAVPAESPMPYNMKPKRTFSAPFRLKKACISPLSKSRLKEDSVWVHIDDSELLSEEFVRQLHRRFRIKGNKSVSSDIMEIDCGSTITSLFNTPNSKSNLNSRLSIQSTVNTSIRRSARFGSHRLVPRTQTLDLLPVKAAQSIAIIMASAHLNPEDIARAIIELKTTVHLGCRQSLSNENTKQKTVDKPDSLSTKASYQTIPDTLLDTLINFMPQMDALLRLCDSPVDTSNLIEADKLLYIISQLRHRLPAHLHALRMLLRYDTAVDQTKQALLSACTCLFEIKHSDSLRQLLSCSLALINALNATRQISVHENGQLLSDTAGVTTSQGFLKRKPFLGFEVRNLVRLADTRDITNQRNLIHYLVELMEMNFTKEAHSWASEIPTLDAAQSLYCAKTIEGKLVEMKRDVARLEIDLRAVGGVACSNNTEWMIKSNSDPKSNAFKANLSFGLVVGQFLAHAVQELKILSELHKTFTERYNEVANYLALDQAKYTADELFNDLKTFKELYQKACASKQN